MGTCFHLGQNLLILSEAKNVSNKTDVKMQHKFYPFYTFSVIRAINDIIKYVLCVRYRNCIL